MCSPVKRVSLKVYRMWQTNHKKVHKPLLTIWFNMNFNHQTFKIDCKNNRKQKKNFLLKDKNKHVCFLINTHVESYIYSYLFLLNNCSPLASIHSKRYNAKIFTFKNTDITVRYICLSMYMCGHVHIALTELFHDHMIRNQKYSHGYTKLQCKVRIKKMKRN